MANNIEADKIRYIKNNKGKNDIVYQGLMYCQKTNLVSEGRRTCLYRCKNKKKCNSSISLKTDIVDGVNYSVIEPFEVTNSRLNHHSTCVPKTSAQLAEKMFIDSCKRLGASDQDTSAKEMFDEVQSSFLSSTQSGVDSVPDFARVKHIFKYQKNKYRPKTAKEEESNSESANKRIRLSPYPNDVNVASVHLTNEEILDLCNLDCPQNESVIQGEPDIHDESDIQDGSYRQDEPAVQYEPVIQNEPAMQNKPDTQAVSKIEAMKCLGVIRLYLYQDKEDCSAPLKLVESLEKIVSEPNKRRNLEKKVLRS